MKPLDVSDVELAFPAGIERLMPFSDPDWKDWRKRYPSREDSWGFKLFHDWFYAGLTKLEMTPKEGIDEKAAIRHIRAIMGSFEPKHEDKTCAVAMLLEQWFADAKWETKKP